MSRRTAADGIDVPQRRRRRRAGGSCAAAVYPFTPCRSFADACVPPSMIYAIVNTASCAPRYYYFTSGRRLKHARFFLILARRYDDVVQLDRVYRRSRAGI